MARLAMMESRQANRERHLNGRISTHDKSLILFVYHIFCCLEGLPGASPRSEICSVPILKICFPAQHFLFPPTVKWPLHKHSNIPFITFFMIPRSHSSNCQQKVFLGESKTIFPLLTLNLLCCQGRLSLKLKHKHFSSSVLQHMIKSYIHRLSDG